MVLLIILVASSAILGALGGSVAYGSDGLLFGATVGIVFGSIAWYVLGTIDRILHERRLDSFFYEQDILTPNDLDLG